MPSSAPTSSGTSTAIRRSSGLRPRRGIIDDPGSNVPSSTPSRFLLSAPRSFPWMNGSPLLRIDDEERRTGLPVRASFLSLSRSFAPSFDGNVIQRSISAPSLTGSDEGLEARRVNVTWAAVTSALTASARRHGPDLQTRQGPALLQSRSVASVFILHDVMGFCPSAHSSSILGEAHRRQFRQAPGELGPSHRLSFLMRGVLVWQPGSGNRQRSAPPACGSRNRIDGSVRPVAAMRSIGVQEIHRRGSTIERNAAMRGQAERAQWSCKNAVSSSSRTVCEGILSVTEA